MKAKARKMKERRGDERDEREERREKTQTNGSLSGQVQFLDESSSLVDSLNLGFCETANKNSEREYQHTSRRFFKTRGWNLEAD